MQELFAEKDFFDWLRTISREYGNAMAEWGQRVHDAASSGAPEATRSLVSATDGAVDRLVAMLVAIGRRHEDQRTPSSGHEVLDSLDRLLGASAELLRDARAGLERQGIAALSALSARIGELRALEADVERASAQLSGHVTDVYGEP